MIRECRGSYRIGDYLIVREKWHLWRVWWLPLADQNKVRAGLPCDGHETLRKARDSVEKEIRFLAQKPAASECDAPAAAG